MTAPIEPVVLPACDWRWPNCRRQGRLVLPLWSRPILALRAVGTGPVRPVVRRLFPAHYLLLGMARATVVDSCRRSPRD